ncbi:lycopene cyclase domain-containing protein [Paramicrobacterium agarici]|uniref:Lycopene cyclase domain-containing protein n=1 Tax=Paramicrobacterium agarici TaxID=630514 RepID=A0A2A9DW93_9MICO|nr:lycopene cyclase domain-containing protein [Microbacterium agarici]PFG30636.1 lycopene cyclase domain-containing protein [Microbacterium agarici]
MIAIYAGCLLVSLTCIGLLDWRFRLALWRSPARSAAIIIVSVAFFAVWDVAGIALGVFRHTESQWATGILLAPHFPVEELIFLVFLSYLTLVMLSGSTRLLARRERK